MRSVAFEPLLTGFHHLIRDVFLLTVAKHISDCVNRYMMTEEGEKDFRKALVCYLISWF